ncbi:hypothetical protein EJB05_00392, partial [Eragrostis curvula]
MERGGGSTVHELLRPTRKRAAAEMQIEEDDDTDDLVDVDVVEGSKHGDGSIYQPDAHYLHRLYHLADTRETRLEAMRLSNPTKDCYPCWTACRQHAGCAMLQIFSLKLSNLPATAAGCSEIELYGFIALRDLLDPLRNYVFNYSRDDPFIIQDINSDPFIYLSGPKRGVYLQCRVLMEYDIRIKKGATEQDDLQLIDGVATFNELTCFQGVFKNWIRGTHGATLDISRALFRDAVEATVQVWITKLSGNGSQDHGLDLSISGYISSIDEEIKLFRGPVKKPCALDQFVVALRLDAYLFLHFKVPSCGSSNSQLDWFAFRVTNHGSTINTREFHFGTVEVKVTWSSLV